MYSAETIRVLALCALPFLLIVWAGVAYIFVDEVLDYFMPVRKVVRMLDGNQSRVRKVVVDHRRQQIVFQISIPMGRRAVAWNV
jgi:hypothetical protein